MTKALVLAGGGAKGSYQVGVWKALNELGWRPDIITGTSVGCLNGVMFALDLYEVARDMWLTIGDSDVMALPSGNGWAELHAFLQDVVKNGGLDVAPLEQIVDRVLDEDALRRAPIRFGLVTVERRGLRARQLTLEEIPQGMVRDYLLASAACFPAFRPREIDGVKYLDGGYSDNMPFGLAKRMGAEELLCVNVDGVGITRPNFSGLPTTVIESHWDLGDLLRFHPQTARRNMELGYYDTLRAFGRVGGTAYALRAGESAERDSAAFRIRYDSLLARCTAQNPALALVEKTALALFGPNAEQKASAPLELAAEKAGADPTVPYTLPQLREAFLAAYQPERARRYERLLRCEAPAPAIAALAAVTPKDFVSALVYAALTDAYTAPPLPGGTALPLAENPTAEACFTETAGGEDAGKKSSPERSPS